MATSSLSLTVDDTLMTDLVTLIHEERDAGLQRLMEVWRQPLAEKCANGWTQAFTYLQRGEEAGTLWAYPDAADSRFREGDLLCLHQGDALMPLIRQMAFEFEENGRWLLRGMSLPTLSDIYKGGRCYADPDTIDLTAFYERALNEIATSHVGRQLVLPLLSNRLLIEFDEREMEEAIEIARAAGCNEKQAEAVGWGHSARHVACIQGPPGTGKTRVLALLVRLAVARGERVLITAHTHTAINHALNKVHAEGVPVAKVSAATRRHGLAREIVHVESLAEWQERPVDGYAVGATPFAIGSRRLDQHEFDTIVFDEASQVTIPLALMAMRRGKRFIFIGDQRQLPPVLLSRSVLDKHKHSVFSRLTGPAASHLVMLEETYRMNRWLSAWPSRTYYNGALRSAGPNRDRRLRLTRVTPRFAEALDGAHPAVFIATPDTNARVKNWQEAMLVADLCQAAVDGGLTLADIGVVTPYRAQGRAIRNCLVQRFGHDKARQVVADTVERMQGQEREMIILSLTTGDTVFLNAVAEFFFQPERLNVSITRAMTKLIVIGPVVAPPADDVTPLLRQWIGWYREMIAQCHHVVL